MSPGALHSRLAALAAVALWLGSSSTLSLGCDRDDDRDPTTEAVEEEPPPDPLAPCREWLAGRWTWGNHVFDVFESGYTIVEKNYKVLVRVNGMILDCQGDTATLSAEGRTGTVTFIDENHLEADVPVYGRIHLTREGTKK